MQRPDSRVRGVHHRAFDTKTKTRSIDRSNTMRTPNVPGPQTEQSEIKPAHDPVSTLSSPCPYEPSNHSEQTSRDETKTCQNRTSRVVTTRFARFPHAPRPRRQAVHTYRSTSLNVALTRACGPSCVPPIGEKRGVKTHKRMPGIHRGDTTGRDTRDRALSVSLCLSLSLSVSLCLSHTHTAQSVAGGCCLLSSMYPYIHVSIDRVETTTPSCRGRVQSIPYDNHTIRQSYHTKQDHTRPRHAVPV